MTESTTTRLMEQAKAVSLLKQARDLLAQRLTDAILDLGEDLLEDARGESFAGEIDTLHEQVATRLNQVNAMLSGLIPQNEVEDRESPRKGRYSVPEPYIGKQRVDLPHVELNPMGTSAPMDSPDVGRYPPSTYPLFVQDIVRRDIVAAGRRLADVLGTTLSQGEAYASRFRDQLDKDPAFLAKVHSLRQSLLLENATKARSLLWECFGLQGLECQAAMQLLKGWL